MIPGRALPLSAQVSNVDFIITRTQFDASGTTYLDAVQYYDGVGFPTQLVQKRATPSQTNLFTLQTYDNRGRDRRSYLPTEKSAGTLYLSEADIASWAAAGYITDTRPYTETLYESAPSNRTISEQGPGTAWSGHAVTTRYGTNTASDSLSCKWYIVLSDGSLSYEGIRPAGTLRTTIVTDEDGRVNILFSDYEGHTLLSRVMNGSQTLDTYSVYDGHENLRYVLEPMYQEIDDLSRYAFIYTYDVLDRLISEQGPGCGMTRYWYDRGGHLTFSQDAVQADAGNWTFHLWDNRHREVLRGVCTKASIDESAILTSVAKVTYSSSSGICGSGYTCAQLSLPGATLLDATYYDNYTFLTRTGFTDRTVFPSANTSVSTNGLPTGRLSAALGSGSQVRCAYYYDAKGRAVMTVTTNLLGGSETETVTYSYTDQPLTRSVSHSVAGTTSLTEYYTYAYDHADRLTTITHKIGNGTERTILSNTYDTMGRLLTESFEGSTSTQRTYSYDIRSYITGISAGSGGSLFSESVGYHSGPGTARYSGAPSSILWKINGENSWRSYLLSYDEVGRLAEASYGSATTSAGPVTTTHAFTEVVTGYDRNGNVTGLQRYGKLAGGGYGLIDNLSIVLSGNQLATVEDTATGVAANGNTSFMNGASVQMEYSYDANGRLIADANKGISSINYNVLGLPSGVTRAGNETVSWVYNGVGTKLRRTVSTAEGNMTTDYFGNAIYEGTTLSRLLIPNGYVTFSGSTPTYHYYQKDHLGSNRMVTNATGSVEQVVHYYPFGGQFDEGTSPSLQPYKFSGKEWDTSLGFNIYDFGARSYDPALLRWTTPDPLMVKYTQWSPYVYCADSPVYLGDPEGKDLVIRGIDDSSVVVFTSSFEKEWDLSSYNVNFQGNYYFDGIESATAFLDAFGIVDPSFIFDGVSSILNLYEGKYWDSALSAVAAVFPYLGDLPKARRAGDLWDIFNVVAHSHHIIPKALFKHMDDLNYVLKRDSELNRIIVPSGFHGNHPAYSKWIEERLYQEMNNGRITPESVEKVINNATIEINKAYINFKKTGENMNSYFKRLNQIYP